MDESLFANNVMINGNNNGNSWIIDSSSTSHFCNDGTRFKNKIDCNCKVKAATGDDSDVVSKGDLLNIVESK